MQHLNQYIATISNEGVWQSPPSVGHIPSPMYLHNFVFYLDEMGGGAPFRVFYLDKMGGGAPFRVFI